MTEQEYHGQLKEILKQGSDGALEEALDRLDHFYSIKPVRLTWYVTKARLEWSKTQSVQHALSIAMHKGWYLYEYPGIQELGRLYMELVGSYQDTLDVSRNRYALDAACSCLTEEEEIWFNSRIDALRKAEKDFLDTPNSKECAASLAYAYFSSENPIMLYFMNGYLRKIDPSYPIQYEWLYDLYNIAYLTEALEDSAAVPFVLMEDFASGSMEFEIVKYILEFLGKELYSIRYPAAFQAEECVDLSESAKISIENAHATGRSFTIPSLEFYVNGELSGDNRDFILAELLRHQLSGKAALVLGSGQLLDQLSCQPVLKKNWERLLNFTTPDKEFKMAFGWAGDYLSYISLVHDTDARALLERPPEISYSIIIPARNSAGTLRYTLMSCLDQRYQGNYEIVLSDNSSPGNTEVYQLYKELDDPRIQYYRTPREYNLSRSFEFAFLHAKGEFLLSIGSDDALLPWTLEALEEIRAQYPKEEIIQWERGFYAWPGFNGGQQHQFVIPKKYQKGVFKADYYSRDLYFGMIFNDSNLMYVLPNLYLNSGCRRQYLKKILERTGRLFDGICQDIYMGVVNAVINDRILYVQYPLAIAGMSDHSMGAKANLVYKPTQQEEAFLNDLKKTALIGGYCTSPYERLMPQVTTDKSSLYNCILRLVARGAIAEGDLEFFDFRKWFLDVFAQMDICDPLFDKKLHYFRYTASLHGDEFLQWFDKTIYHQALQPKMIDEEQLQKLRQKKTYQEEGHPNGGCTLDASAYGVSDVYGAARLFAKLTKL